MASNREEAAQERSNDIRTAILVLGMHRSGTSATSRVLSLIGCDLPAHVMGPSESNAAGHWESDEIYRLNNRILESAGSAWHDWQAVNEDWFASRRAEESRKEAIGLVDSEFGKSHLFVLKDPRICRLAPFWLDVFSHMGIDVRIVAPLRNPLEVAASLHSRNGFPPAYGQLLWLRHVLDAERFTRGLPRYFFNYENLLENWAGVFDKAKPALGLVWPRMSSQTAGEVEEFLTVKLRHHAMSRESVLANPTLSVWLRDTYETLCDWGSQGECEAGIATLDAVDTALRVAEPAFAGPIAAGMTAITQHRDLAAKHKKLMQQHEALAAAEDRLQLELREREAVWSEERDLAQESLNTARNENVELRHKLQQTAHILENHRQEKTEYEETSKQQEETLRAEMKRLETEKREVEAALVEKEKAIAEKEKVNTGLKEHVHLLMDDVGRMESEVEQLKAQKQAAEAARRAGEAIWHEVNRVIAAMLVDTGGPLMPRAMRVRRKMARFAATGLFDKDWYLKDNPDVAQSGMDPLRHYVQYGAREGRAPNARLKGPGGY